MKKPKQTKAEEPSYFAKYKYYLLTLVLALAVFGVCAYLVGLSPRMYLLEYNVLVHINDWPDGLRLAFITATTLGSIWMAAFSVAFAFFIRLYQLAWRFALSIFTVYGLQVLLKHFFERPRPEGFEPLINARVTESGFGFPSTHAAVGAVFLLTLLPYLPRGWRWPIVVGGIIAVALSRVYLGVHSPLDVVAGVAVGTGVVCFWRLQPKPIKKILHLK